MNCKPNIKRPSRHKSDSCSTSSVEVNTKRWQNISVKFVQNLKLGQLKAKLENEKDSIVYSYIVRTVDMNEEDKFIQTGSSPNLEGDEGTLTCCKHRMSTFPKIMKGTWIAGVTSINADKNNKLNYLFYLGKIKEIAPTFLQLRKKLSERSVNCKNASKNPLGDLVLVTKYR